MNNKAMCFAGFSCVGLGGGSVLGKHCGLLLRWHCGFPHRLWTGKAKRVFLVCVCVYERE